MNLGKGRDCVRVGGMGGCFGPSDYERQSKYLQGYAKRHYTRDEIDDLCRHSGIDVLLVHHHTRLDAEVAGIRCIGLNKVAMPGNLIAVVFEAHGRGWSLLGEWAAAPVGGRNVESRPTLTAASTDE